MTSVFYLKYTNIHILVIMRIQHFLKVKLKQINQDKLATTVHLLHIYNCIEYCFYILWKHELAIFLIIIIIIYPFTTGAHTAGIAAVHQYAFIQ